MPKNKLNVLSVSKIESLKPQLSDYMVNDGGGLYLRIRPHGVKEWIFRYTSPKDQKRRSQSIGQYPMTSLKKARESAGKKRELIDEGLDPALVLLENARNAEVELAEQAKKSSNTIFAMFPKWKSEDLQNRKDKGKEAERIFRKDVFPLIGNKPVNDVTRDDIKKVCEQAKNRNSNNRLANLIMTELRQFYRYLQDEELVTLDPTRALRKDRIGGKEKPRKRYLKHDDLIVLKRHLDVAINNTPIFEKPNLEKHYAHAILLYLATGCRRTEIAHACYKNIHIEKRTFHIPAEKAKNTDEHDVYLSDFALAQIEAIKKLTGTVTWLLPNEDGTRPIGKEVITNQIRWRQPKINKAGIIEDSKRHDSSLELPNGKWILHDLRRTTGTLMQQLGINPLVVKKCLNQRVDDKMIETYQRAEYLKEQQNAFIMLGKYLITIFGDLA